jgi:hypothetical protein
MKRYNENYNGNRNIETVMTRQEWERVYEKKYRRNYRCRLRNKIVNSCKGIIVGSLFLCAIGCAGASDFEDEGVVIRSGMFYEVNGNQYIHTNDGNYWEVSSLDFDNGDKVDVVFRSNYTSTAEDDVITNVEIRWF